MNCKIKKNCMYICVLRSVKSSWRVWEFLSSPQGLKSGRTRASLSTLMLILLLMNC